MATVILIEGSIASFKSTLCNELDSKLEDVVVIHEPVDLWTQYSINDESDNYNLLSEYYNGLVEPFDFQILILYSYYVRTMSKLKEAKQTNAKIIIINRHVYSSIHVFGTVYRLMSDFQFNLLERFAKAIFGDILMHIDFAFFLETSPQTSLERVKKRGRAGEVNNIDIEYLTALQKAYSDWKDKSFAPLTIKELYILPEESDIRKHVQFIVDILKQE